MLKKITLKKGLRGRSHFESIERINTGSDTFLRPIRGSKSGGETRIHSSARIDRNIREGKIRAEFSSQTAPKLRAITGGQEINLL